MMTRQLLLPALFAVLLAACSGEAKAPEKTSKPIPTEQMAAQMGQALFGECSRCHQIDPAKGHRIGPNLYDVYGSPAARHADFRYSKALKIAGITWTDETLDGYLESPMNYVSGGRMSYRGQADAEKRKALIAYLKTLTDESSTNATTD